MRKKEGEAENSNSCIEDINQINDSDINVIQKNIVILYFDGSYKGVPNLKPLEKVIGEAFNLEIDEQGDVRLNDEKVEIKELEDGSRAFLIEQEELKKGKKDK